MRMKDDRVIRLSSVTNIAALLPPPVGKRVSRGPTTAEKLSVERNVVALLRRTCGSRIVILDQCVRR